MKSKTPVRLGVGLFFIGFLLLVSCRHDKYDPSVTDLTNQPLVSEKMPGEWIDALAIDSRGKLWLSTSEIDHSVEVSPLSSSLPIKHYLSSYYQNTYTMYDNHFIGAEGMAVDKDDKLWFYHVKSLYYFDGQISREAYKIPRVPGRFYWITSDRDGNIWAGGINAPLVRAVKNPDITISNIGADEVPSTAAHFDSYNNMWIALWDGGISKRTPAGEWTSYNQRNTSLPYQNFWAITSDKENNIWAGTGWQSDMNLFKFNGSAWVQVIPKDEKGNTISGTVRQLYYDSQKVWILSEISVNSAFDSNYLVTFDGTSWNRIYDIPLKDGIADIAIDIESQVAWIGTMNSGLIGLNIHSR